MPKYGGNQAGNGAQPFDMLKWGNMASPDVKAVVGAVHLWGDVGEDLNFGLPLYGQVPQGNTEDPDGGTRIAANLGTPNVPAPSRRTRNARIPVPGV